MNRETFLALLSKKMRNELSREERERLEQCMEENREFRQLSEAIGTAGSHRTAVVPDMEDRLSEIWKRIAEGAPAPEPRRLLQPGLFIKIAAVFLLIAGGIAWILYKNKPTKEGLMEVLSTTNEKLYTALPDGTQVTLNYHSTLEYNTDFGDGKRKIILQGEAFFDVTANEKVPLQVLAGPLMVEVKGTAFNVEAYKNDPGIKVVLLRGAVEVSRRGDRTDKVLLKPNQWLWAPNTSGGTVQFHIDSIDQQVTQRLHWKDDSLVFKKEPLQHIARKLEKKYGVTIEIRTEALKEKRFSGILVNESLADGLEALKTAYPFSYKIEDKKVTIR
ncbi:FecR domain-containing protein [Niabella aurantiaca]|uniref:FecR domain-containing protein n=1 Tax=Niabella aurantiaca TaxID=379900 RepID=UPI00035D53F4|nr:FecR domain-containing protein [Niabella aurantiaca]